MSSSRSRKLVVAALVRKGGRVLMSRRRPDQPMPLLWEFPGGKVEPGEHPEAALVREVREELGCTVVVDGIFEVVFHAYPEFDLVMLVYAASLVDSMKDMALAARKAPASEFFTMPGEMLFMNRLQFGFYSVLARLREEEE